MNIAVTGSSGLVGKALVGALQRCGDDITRLVRGTSGLPEDYSQWAEQLLRLDKLDAVVHLAGESIASGRWTKPKKERILSSRVNSTRALAGTVAKLARRPRALVCASAIGFYGTRGDETLTENSAKGFGFLAEVCRSWEAAADPTREVGIRVVHLRFGMILAGRGGALAKMLTPFRLGAGGIIGDGRQYWSWVALDDVVRAILFTIENEQVAGPVNVVSPQPVTNLEFTKALGTLLRRPTVLPMPAFAARLALGEMADELLLASARVQPQRLMDAGFKFQHPELKEALHAVLNQGN
jgi:uncharacterized protein (TIGR01777 family)